MRVYFTSLLLILPFTNSLYIIQCYIKLKVCLGIYHWHRKIVLGHQLHFIYMKIRCLFSTRLGYCITEFGAVLNWIIYAWTYWLISHLTPGISIVVLLKIVRGSISFVFGSKNLTNRVFHYWTENQLVHERML